MKSVDRGALNEAAQRKIKGRGKMEGEDGYNSYFIATN